MVCCLEEECEECTFSLESRMCVIVCWQAKTFLSAIFVNRSKLIPLTGHACDSIRPVLYDISECRNDDRLHSPFIPI